MQKKMSAHNFFIFFFANSVFETHQNSHYYFYGLGNEGFFFYFSVSPVLSLRVKYRNSGLEYL